MKIMKFGGSSLADAQKIAAAATIVEDAQTEEQIVVVLSAMKGVTDMLIEMAQEAEQGNKNYDQKYAGLLTRVKTTVGELFGSETASVIQSEMERTCQELHELLHGIELVRECSKRTLDLILSFGERLNTLLFSRYLSRLDITSTPVDARNYIVTDERHGNASVMFEKTYRKIQSGLTQKETVYVVPGFIASTESGATTTLGRNGSDFTASIFGAALSAERIEIWTDVDGVYSADPKVVKNSFVLPNINFQEAMELSYFGAKVIHPFTMLPALDREIPIVIKNTFNPEAPGTMITSSLKRHAKILTGVASIENVALINIEGGGMIGVIGIASRVFSALAGADVNVVMISQASSEHSICIVCREAEAENALFALENEFKEELVSKKIQQFELLRELEIIAVIGENMRGTPGISGKMFSALGERKINILAIAQGSSERNISFVIHKNDTENALNTIHRTFLE